MLTKLIIQNIVLIEKLSLELANGLNVFTGETGAGKSILLDALGLALGERGDVALIRNGAETAQVTACFQFDTPYADLKTLLDELDLDYDGDIILRRSLTREGKSRAFLNDQQISISSLKKIGQLLLEIHGQYDTLGLLNPSMHRNLLDSFANTSDQKSKVRTAYAAWHNALSKEKELIESIERTKTEEDYLRACLHELDDLSPQDNEYSHLTEQRGRLQNLEKLREASSLADESISGEKGAIHTTHIAAKAISKIADKISSAQDILKKIDDTLSCLSDLGDELSKQFQTLKHSNLSLDEIEDRLFKIRSIARKHNVSPEDLSSLYHKIKSKLTTLEDQDLKATDLAKEVIRHKTTYIECASTLGAMRAHAANELTTLIQKELPPLKLEKAKFYVENLCLNESEWNAEGRDKITFLASTNPSTELSPIHKCASGGELARFMLAIKVVLSKGNPIPTLVFDEVDTGIGGATASAVGDRLLRLAETVQVLVITHSPQVAARGEQHIKVSKVDNDDKTYTNLSTLDRLDKIEEIARMLSGNEVTNAARDAALSLINDSQKNSNSKKIIKKRATA